VGSKTDTNFLKNAKSGFSASIDAIYRAIYAFELTQEKFLSQKPSMLERFLSLTVD
jgi:hypothetical protein